ncbi:PAS domain-containing protein [Halomicronema sp. CCY15110]|uniref:PAS domain-containing protein n=1 Tax=Halomicronema sp. CCY15110 TaxID=2767773 RepID=UPI0019529267|nr:PAS domain-containing protein [Halomicronema sp. CCY15110]
MGISQQIEAVYQRALLLKERAEAQFVEPDLLEAALKEFYFVLEELHTADEDIRQQHAQLAATHQTLQAERQRYQALFELAPDAYLVTDGRGIVHRANQAAETLFSRSRPMLIWKPLTVLVAAEDRPRILNYLTQPNPPQDWQVTLLRPDHELVTVAVTTTLMTNPNSEGVAILWLLRDMTAHQAQLQTLQTATQTLEQQVAQYKAELAQVQAQLQTEIARRNQGEQTRLDGQT